MAKAPQDPREIFEELTEDYRGLYGDDLVSIILYGSAAGKAYRPGKSDINFMIVLSEEGIGRLERAFGLIAKWRKRRVAIPLFLTAGYIESSLDVFPIEYLSFQRKYVLVYGKDVLKDLSFETEHVRLQCEREIKGKLLLLREAYLETEGRGKDLKAVIGHSLPAVTAILEALLFLREEEWGPEPREIAGSACEAYGLDRGLLDRLFDIKEERGKPGEDEIRGLYARYLEEVRRLAKIVDGMGE